MSHLKSNKRIVVIGAGAAGMLAAGRAAEMGAEVVLLERMRQVGRKVRISGKGRCNITNTLPTSEFIKHFNKRGKFLRQAMARFSSEDLIAFLNGRGLKTKVERGGRIFPESDSAVEVAETLLAYAEDMGARVITGARVRGIDLSGGKVSGVHYDLFEEDGKQGSGGDRGSQEITADAVIMATGGKSYPATGSTGDGYDLVRDLGHTVTECRPSLVPLEAVGAPPEGVGYLNLRNIEITLWIDGKLRCREFGELTFVKTGLSGPVILEVSRIAVKAFDEGKRLELGLDLKPALDHKKLDARLMRDLENRDLPTWGDLLAGLLPAKLIPAALGALQVPADKPRHQVTGPERKALRNWLKDQRFPITGYGSFKEAIVTAGGVDLKEVDPRTMESKLVAGLYIVGELLDLDADTGGYNMTGAFSTGWVCGEAAATALNDGANE
jgi:predicted Rossmann fold flavoprotein